MIDFVVLLAAIDTPALEAIIAAIGQLPGVLPALQAWVEHAARWECDRRRGFDYPLQAPAAALSKDEIPDAITAAAMIGECFRHERRRDVSAVLAFFDGLRQALSTAQRTSGAGLH